MFGHPEGVKEGEIFRTHADLYAAGLHRFSGQGISGTEETGVDSIVLSGGYVDDKDMDDEIIYTGRGGRDRETGNQVADQSFDDTSNAGLVISRVLGKPVRVMEGLDIRGTKRRRAHGGYLYRGLYRVANHWMTIGQEHFRVCQFQLLKLRPGEVVTPQPLAPDMGGETELERQARRYIERQRLVRDSRAAMRVKEMYEDTCQMCLARIVVSPTGAAYSEAAHIQAVGQPHNGPDILANLLCLCPTCHVRFDRGALQITDGYDVFDGLKREVITTLSRLSEHRIRLEFLQQHRGRWVSLAHR